MPDTETNNAGCKNEWHSCENEMARRRFLPTSNCYFFVNFAAALSLVLWLEDKAARLRRNMEQTHQHGQSDFVATLPPKLFLALFI